MTRFAPVSAVRTAARRVWRRTGRVRFVLARLLGPWGWALAGLGVLLTAVPPGWSRLPPWDVLKRHHPYARLVPPGRSGGLTDELFYGRDHPDPQCDLPDPAFAVSVAAPPGRDGRAAWHGRAVAVRWDGPREPVGRGLPGPSRSDPAERAWAGTTTLPRWGLGVRKRHEGPGALNFPGGRLGWRRTRVTVAVVWLAGFPLAWSLLRLADGVRHGWDRPPPRPWRRAARPWVGTFAALAAALLAFGGATPEWRPRGPTLFDRTVTVTARRDYHARFHPRFVRLTLDGERPADPVPGRPAWGYGDRRCGLRADRWDAPRPLPGYAVFDPDSASTFEPRSSRVAVDVSLWYLLLPAAAWSAVGLWRTRRRRAAASVSAESVSVSAAA